jgi:hypothetical protein
MIRTQTLFREKQARFNGRGSEDFQEVFLEALNATLIDLSHRLVGMSYTAIEDLEDNIDEDAEYRNAISAGLDWYIQKHGQWAIDSKEDLDLAYRRERSTLQAQVAIDAEVRWGWGGEE